MQPKTKENLPPNRRFLGLQKKKKKKFSWPNAATLPRAAKQTQNSLRDRHPTVAADVWREVLKLREDRERYVRQG